MALGVPACDLGHVPARELMEWAAYEKIHGPILIQERIDVAAATICAALIAASGGEAVNPADLLPVWDEADRKPSEPESPEAIIAKVRQMQLKKKEQEADRLARLAAREERRKAKETP